LDLGRLLNPETQETGRKYSIEWAGDSLIFQYECDPSDSKEQSLYNISLVWS